MSADRRKRGVWAIIVDDLFRKMVAIGLAVLLWFFIESRIMDSETFTLPLTWDNQMKVQGTTGDRSEFVVFLPSGIAKRRFLNGDTAVTTIDVKMSGPRYKIEDLKNNPLRLKVMTLLGLQWNRNREINGDGEVVDGSGSDIEVVDISAADIERDIRYDNITIELIPSRIRAEVEIRDTITFELTPSRVKFETKGDHRRMREDSATFTPSQMTLVGPAKVLRSLEKRKQVFRAELSFGSLDNSATSSLTVIDGVNLKVFPEDGAVSQVTVPLKLERKTYTLKLPLVVRDKRLDQVTKYESDEKIVPVGVSFSGRLGLVMGGKDTDARQQWATQNLRLEVYLNELATGAPLGPELQLSPWILLDGPLLHRYPNTEYLLEESLTVTVRAKK
jgi:hypothetical protein